MIPAEKIRCHAVRYDPGGGGVNVARALHRLGQPVVPLLAAGGASGEMLVAQLVAEGLSPDVVPIAGITRSNFAVFEERSGRQYRFVLPGPDLSPSEVEMLVARIRAYQPRPAWLVASGSLPPNVPVDFYARLARLARDDGLRLVLDARGEPLRLALEAGVFAVKPSLAELEALTGRDLARPSDQEAVCRDLVAGGRAEVVALSLGVSGALLVWSGGSLRLSSPPVEALTTIGAGDSFTAGLTLGMIRGLAWREVLRLALAAGASALRYHGTQLGEAKDIDALLAAGDSNEHSSSADHAA